LYRRSARIRELETTIETLNRRLVDANQRAQTAESHAMAVIKSVGNVSIARTG
jgi:hypothetical protein